MADDKATLVERRSGGVGKSQPPRDEPKPFALARRYETGAEIARGGMGRVVEATDTRLDRVVAVKEALTDDPDTLRRFARETKITARLEHPSIVPVYDAGSDSDRPFYVMRRVSGQPLAEIVAATPALDGRLALVPRLLAAAQAIAHAHGRGVIHRDIKPTNILVGELGETVVIDWGLAKVIGEPDDDDSDAITAGDSLQTRVGTVFGTPGFMAPEQIRGEPAGPSGDVYALGASLYYLLTRRVPHHAKTGDEMMVLAATSPPQPIGELVDGVPAELVTIVETALAHDDRRRYRDAAAFADDLSRFLDGQLVATHHYSPLERLGRFVRRHRAAVAIATTAIVVLAVVGIVAVRRVVAERDRADRESKLAGERLVETQAAREQDRARSEQLLLQRARVLVDTAPTHALAVLKQLPATSPRVPEARAIVRAARMRGTTRVLRGPREATARLEMSPLGDRLMQQTRADSTIRIWDLVNYERPPIAITGIPDACSATWLSNDRLVLYRACPTEIFDVTTQQRSATALPRLTYLRIARSSSYAIATDDQQRALRIDFRDLAAPPLRFPVEQVTDAHITEDGRFSVVAAGGRTTIFDDQATVRAVHDFKPLASVFESAGHRILGVDGNRVVQIDLDAPQPAWSVVPESVQQPYDQPITLIEGRHGYMLARNGIFFHGLQSYVPVGRIGSFIGTLVPAGDGAAIASASTRIALVDREHVRTVHLPALFQDIRIAGRIGVPRIAVVGHGMIGIVDITHVLPRMVEAPGTIVHELVSDSVMIASRSMRFAWVDITTGKSIPIDLGFVGMERYVGFAHGYALFQADDRGAMLTRAVATNQREPLFVHRGDAHLAAVTPSGAALFGDGNTLVYRATPGAEATVVTTMAGPLTGLQVLDDERFVATTETEAIRGLPNGRPYSVERIAMPAAKHQLVMYTSGTYYVGWGTEVSRWDPRPGTRTLEKLATLPSPILGYAEIAGGALFRLEDGTTHLVQADRVPSTLAIASNHSHATVAADGNSGVLFDNGHVESFDFVTRQRWALPIESIGVKALAVSPTGRVVVDGTTFPRAWVLPVASTRALADELEQLTNATENAEGVLGWSWQQQ